MVGFWVDDKKGYYYYYDNEGYTLFTEEKPKDLIYIELFDNQPKNIYNKKMMFVLRNKEYVFEFQSIGNDLKPEVKDGDINSIIQFVSIEEDN